MCSSGNLLKSTSCCEQLKRMSDIFQEVIFSSWKNHAAEKVMCMLCEIRGGKCRNHFLSNLITTLILVMLDAFEANLSNMKAYK